MRRTGTALTIFGLALALASPALAETAPSRTVRIDLTQLATPEGVAAAYAEVVEAAREVCGQSSDSIRDRRLCINDAVETGIRDAAIPELLAYQAAQAEAPLATTLASR